MAQVLTARPVEKPVGYKTFYSANPVLTYFLQDGTAVKFVGGTYTAQTAEEEKELLAAAKVRGGLIAITQRRLWHVEVLGNAGTVTSGMSDTSMNPLANTAMYADAQVQGAQVPAPPPAE